MASNQRHHHTHLRSESDLVAIAAALGAAQVGPVSNAEKALLVDTPQACRTVVARVRRLIRAGKDPLGDAFARLRSPEERRPFGATYTPPGLVEAMLRAAQALGAAERVVDPGSGSGRFLVRAGEMFPDAALVAVELDPLAALLTRANLAASGLRSRARVVAEDYRSFHLPKIDGPTLFVGNPPYVRHHQIAPIWKDWLTAQAQILGYSANLLAGLHVHFILATLAHAQEGDFGCFITAAEWLDVKYGKLVRDLFLRGLGGHSLIMIEPTARPFPDAATTAVVFTFRVGDRPKAIGVRRLLKPSKRLANGAATPIRRERFESESRWSHILTASRTVPPDFIELGELFRVHRGQVTGANRVWIAGPRSRDLPAEVLFPSVTRARELFAVDGVLSATTDLRNVIDLPVDLTRLADSDRKVIRHFLDWAITLGAHQTYVARHRRAWWSVGLREPPPILATYMARRPPAFVVNAAEARYINIAHGLYPREPLSATTIRSVARYLSSEAFQGRGRIYAGGLLKFEPREMERIPVPHPDVLDAYLP